MEDIAFKQPVRLNFINPLSLILFALPLVSFRFILTFLPVPYLLTTQVTFYFGFLIFIFLLIQALPETNYFKSSLLWALTIYFVILLGIDFINGRFGVTDFVFITNGLTVPLLFACGYIYRRCPDQFTEFRSIATSAPFLLLALVSIASFVFTVNRISLSDTSRMFPGIDFPATFLAYYCGCLLVIAFTLLILTVNSRSRGSVLIIFLALGVVILSAIGMLSTQSRGAPLYALITLVLVTFLAHRSKLIKYRRLLAYSAIPTGLTIIVIYASGDAAIFQRLELFVDRMIATTQGYGDSSGRSDLLTGRLEIWQEGIRSTESWIFAGKDADTHTLHSHNIIIEVIVRYGMFAIPLFLLIIKALKNIVISVFDANRLGPTEILIIGVFCFSFAQSMTSIGYSNMQFLWFSLGYCQSIKDDNK